MAWVAFFRVKKGKDRNGKTGLNRLKDGMKKIRQLAS